MLILASASPRRQEILKSHGYTFEVIPSNCKEVIDTSLTAEKIVKSLAEQKALSIASSYPEDTVIGADTIVVNDGSILGKPKDKSDAIRMLRSLSGKTHLVITGVAIIKGEQIKVFANTTEVTFYKLKDEEIQQYVDSGEPMDKAGSYAIQGLGGLFVKRICGDYLNVVGLPMSELHRELKKFNYTK